jgi:hypothetical protein
MTIKAFPFLLISLCILSSPFKIIADCISLDPQSTSFDTISPGTVKVTKCYNQFITNLGVIHDTCILDTSYEKELLDSLQALYSRYSHMVILQIDSVVSIPDTIWREDAVRESVQVVIDSNLKGIYNPLSFWLAFNSYCTEGFGILHHRPFISFFDTVKSISTLGIDPGHFIGLNIGIDPGNVPGILGYFLINNRIVSSNFPGVSVDLQEFISAMTSQVRFPEKRPSSSAFNSSSTVIQFDKSAVYSLDGRLLGIDTKAARLKLPRGLYIGKSQTIVVPRLRMIR